MKVLGTVALTLVLAACGKTPESAVSSEVPVEPNGEMNMLGGRSLTSANEVGVGKMLPQGGDACTFTRIGQRHFLSAYHCLTKDNKNLFDKVSIVMQSAKSEKLAASKEFGFDSRFAAGAFKPISGDTKSYWNLFAQIYNGYEDWIVFTLDHSDLEKSADIYKYLNDNYAIKPLAPRTNTYLFEQVSSIGWGENNTSDGIIAKCSTKRPITCKSDVLDDTRYDDSISPALAKSAKFRIDMVGRMTSSNSQGIIMHTAISIPKDGIIRVPKNEVDWGILAPGDAGGPLLDRNNRLLGVNGSLYNNGDALLGAWWALQLSTKINPDNITKIVNKAIVDSAKEAIDFEESFAAFGYRMASVNAVLKSSGARLAKVACSAKELAGKESLILSAKMIEGSDYVCFKGPAQQGLSSDSITIEEAGNSKDAYRKVIAVKEAPKCDSSITNYPVSMEGFILTAPYLKDNFDIYEPGPIVLTFPRQAWDDFTIANALLSGVQSKQNECWKTAANGIDCELFSSPGRVSFDAYGLSVEMDTHVDSSNAFQVDLTPILQAYKNSQDFRDNKDLVVLVNSLKPYAEEFFQDKNLKVTGCYAQ